MNWRPIETAPRDGTEFIACRIWKFDNRNVPVMQVCRWIDEEHGAFRGEHIVITWNYDPFPKATHWMPKPPTPITT